MFYEKAATREYLKYCLFSRESAILLFIIIPNWLIIIILKKLIIIIIYKTLQKPTANQRVWLKIYYFNKNNDNNSNKGIGIVIILIQHNPKQTSVNGMQVQSP